MENIKARATAYIVPIKAIHQGEFVKDEGEYGSSYLSVDKKKMSRVNLIGIIISKDQSNDAFLLDDGEDKVSIRNFEYAFASSDLKVGDVVLVIGRIRDFDGDRYIMPEIVKGISSKWLKVRKKEIGSFMCVKPIDNQEGYAAETVPDVHKRIISSVREFDHGEGAHLGDVLANVNIPDCEKLIDDMLKEGELFENMPGKIKVLD